jgi:ATP-dependent phosphofructokinase / diphosphate-dependent phosphofructokinase
MTKKRIGFLNSGGDCPGLNTVMDAAVRALHSEYEILGFYKGFEGIFSKEYKILTPEFTTRYKFMGGTVLKSVNRGHFAVKVGLGETESLAKEVVEKTVKNYKELNLEGIIAVGGDGTLTVAKQLSEAGLNIVAVPKSIDNDLYGTDFTFGFQTAVSIAGEALDRLETTGYSHDRVMILEVMGRNAGWIGLFAGIASGANAILIPEIPFSFEGVYNFLKKRPKKNALVVISEGAKPLDGDLKTKDIGGVSSEFLLGGVGESLTKFLNSKPEIEARNTALGHIQRGGSPNSFDRILSRLYGVQAANLFKQKKFGYMASYQYGQITEVKIEDAVAKLKTVEPKSSIVQMAKDMGIYFGD